MIPLRKGGPAAEQVHFGDAAPFDFKYCCSTYSAAFAILFLTLGSVVEESRHLKTNRAVRGCRSTAFCTVLGSAKDSRRTSRDMSILAAVRSLPARIFVNKTAAASPIGPITFESCPSNIPVWTIRRMTCSGSLPDWLYARHGMIMATHMAKTSFKYHLILVMSEPVPGL